LGPVWKKDMKWMKRALLNWHHEMLERGLSTEDDIKMEDFVKGNLKTTENHE